MMARLWFWLLLVLGAWASAGAQSPSRGALGALGAERSYPSFELEYVEPQVHKWYAPRHLQETYWQPWYQSASNYARYPYTRYVDRLLEGDDFYDLLGSQVGRGWQVYSWTQEQPQAQGSQINKQPTRQVRNSSEALAFGTNRGTNAYGGFFNRLVIAGDEREQTAYRLMVGDQIDTRFTPLTFSKPRYNGLRLDLAGARHSATLLLSRVSDPNGSAADATGTGSFSRNGTNATHMLGGHADLALGDLARLGLSYVNVHNAHTQLELNNGNPLNGTLTIAQNQSLRSLWVRLRDDSPGDLGGGAVLLAHDIVLVDTSGRELRGSEIGLLPEIEGGANRGGVLVADGSEYILLAYDLAGLDYEGVRSADLQSARVELNLANDYRVEVASNLQADGVGSAANTVFLTSARAEGNVRDRSNTGLVGVGYGLPVANEIYGVDWNMPDWRGLSLAGEVALNRRLRRYPNPALDKHQQLVETAGALYGQLAYQRWSWQLFAEAFSLDDDYGTSYWLTDPGGTIFYRAAIPQVYELVDDDDDFNGVPEWPRPFQPNAQRAWPGYDENGDFINDQNQNFNLVPDYAEPFLRYLSDRPEFLFGLDMNHNGTVDRFENDLEPDYPYKRDHRGFNAYLKGLLGPDAGLTVGRQDMRLIAGDGRTESWYLLASWVRTFGDARLRLFEHAALVRDDIADDLLQWFQPVDAQGRMLEMPDALPAQDTWKNVFYADWDQHLGPGIRMQHRFKWEAWRQRDSDASLARREGRRESGFLGLINRAQWSVPVGLATLQPRFKSEFRHERPFSVRRPASTSLEETAILLWTQPLMAETVGVAYFPRYGRQRFNTELQLGLEFSRLWLLEGRREDIGENFSRWTTIIQLSNRVAYEGYQLATRTGLRLSAWNFSRRRDQRTNTFFLTIIAGLR